PPTFTTTPPQYVEAKEGGITQLSCTALGNPKPTISWLREGEELVTDSKYTVHDGIITILAINRDDRGAYTCRAHSDQGEVLHTTRLLEPPYIVSPPENITVNISQNALFTCQAEAYPGNLTYTWFWEEDNVYFKKWEKDGYPLRVEKFPGWSQTPDGSIRVAEATEDSLGTYTCVPYKRPGDHGHDPPYFNVRPGGEYRQEAGRELVIPCAASGDPEIPTITWRKVGKPSKSKHNVLPSGSLQFQSLSKEDHGEWECVATNVVTSITASTRLLVIGTSPHAPGNIHVLASITSANVSWEPGYDGGFEQTFSTWLVVTGLETRTEYQFSVLAQNKLGTGPFSEVVTHGVLLTWLPPANHSSPVDRYIMEFRLGERWEVLEDLIPATETELIARDLIQESWYEFRVMAVMDDLISDSSNVGLARPVVAGVVATICFLAAAVLFSTLAACFVNKQHRRKLKRKPDPPLSVTHFRKSIESPLSSGKISPESSPPSRPRSLSSDSSHGPGLYVRKLPSPLREKDKELSFYKKTKRAIASKKYSVSKHEAEVTTPIELISRGPDGRFIMDASPPSRRIQGFPFAEESDMYPEFRQSDEENDFDPGPLPPIMPTLRPQLSPTSSSLESTQPPTYSPRLHRAMEGMSFAEGGTLHASGQAPASRYRGFPQGPFYGYMGSRGESGIPPPFYMPDISPRSSALSSPPGTAEGPFGYPSIPEESGDLEHHQYTASGHSLSLTHSPVPRSPESWQPHEFPFLGLEGPRFIYPPHHPLHHPQDLPDPPPLPPSLAAP
ncbi:hypothetical protein CRUP_001877, partial [Coryphaenoides rupestris]